MASKRFAVYTAIFGGYDNFVQVPQGDFDFYLFGEVERGAGWGTFKRVQRQFDDPTRDARRIKILSHEMLPEYEYTLWLDGSVRAIKDIDFEFLINTWLKEADVAVFEHPYRDCLYEEAAMLWHFERDKREVIREQVKRYRALGFPPGKGLGETAIVLRKNTKAVSFFNDCWWNEVKYGSRRDQLSFPFAVWLSRLNYRFIEGVWGGYGFAKELHLK